MRVHAIFELNRRELLPLLLLGRHLRARGAEFELEQMRLASNRMFADARCPAVRLLPFLYDDVDVRHLMGYAKWTGEAAVNLCWEQLRNSWARKLIPSGKMIDAGMVCLAWGRNYQAELLAAGIPPDQVRVTGNMRFDLPLHPEWLLDRSFLAARYGLDPDKPWLLIPWNLHVAAQQDAGPLRMVCKRFDLPFPQDLLDAARQTRAAFFELIPRIVEALPDHELILRAHPSGDDVKQLSQHLGYKGSGIRVINELDLANWVIQSRVVLGWMSTSLLDAVAAGVPAICFEPVPFSEPFDYDVGRMVPRTQQIDDAIDRLRRPERLPHEVNRQLFNAWYGPVDGHAHQRVADLCFELADRIDEFRIPTNINRPRISRLRNASRRLLQRSPRWAPALAWFAHGRHRKTVCWLPQPLVEQLTAGAPIERFTQWLA